MSSVISSLAILKVEWDAGRDYIDSFLPFVLEAVRATDNPIVSLSEVDSFLREEFGLSVPHAALKTILQRAVKNGYVHRSEGVYHKNRKKLQKVNLRKKRADIIRQQEALVEKLRKFAQSEFSTNWNVQDTEQLLLSFIQKESLPILAASIEGLPINLPTQHEKKDEYITASFIQEIERADPEAFGFLETITKGTMLSSVLYFPTLGEVKQKFIDAKIILDTPVVLKVLGLTVKDEQKLYEEMIDLLYELNANIYCFEHSLREIRGVLHAASLALSRPSMLRDSRADSIEFFIRNGSKSSDVEFILAKLENYLVNHHIRIIPNPPCEPASTIDEEGLGNLLMDRIGYGQKKTMEHDLKAIACIFTLRGGSFPQTLEQCQAIFVTDNIPLVRTTLGFFKQQYGDEATRVPLCIPHHTISTLAWLKKPLRKPDIPNRMLSATCYAALNPPEMLWRIYLEEIEHLSEDGHISEDDYYLLRFSSEARSLLMAKTLGEKSAFAEGTVLEILEYTKETIRSSERQKFESERLSRLRTEDEAREYKSVVLHRISKISSRAALIISRCLSAILLIILLIGSYFSFPGIGLVKSSIIQTIVSLALGITFLFSLANLIFGTSLRSLVRSIENACHGWIKSNLSEFITGEK